MEDMSNKENVQTRSNVTHYVIEGKPIPLARPRFSEGHVFDSQKRQKFGIQLQLKSQHQGDPFVGPLQLDITFFMKIPDSLSKKSRKDKSTCPHFSRPDIDNLEKMTLDCACGIIYADDSQIAVMNARKIYSHIPRTEFSITRLDPDGRKDCIAEKA